MERLQELSEEVVEIMDLIESRREAAISSSRKIIRCTKHVIHSIHSGKEHQTMLNDTGKMVKSILKELSNAPWMFHSPAIQDAMAEFAEASVLSSIVLKHDIPSFNDLGISPQAWILGLADTVGEVRRMILDTLMRDLQEAERLFAIMESIHDVLMIFDVSDAIVPIRRKQDISRSLVERTRTDITTARIMRG